MKNFALVSGASFSTGPLPSRSQIKTSADLNGDGEKDFIIQNLATGELTAWIMRGTDRLEIRSLGLLSDPAWLVVGAADFNGDSRADLVFQHPTRGLVSIWFMNGTTFVSGQALISGALNDVNWRIIGTVDMNNDRRPDLVWQNLTSGVVTSWLMNGTAMAAAGPFSSSGPADSKWRLSAVADIDDDGDLDFIWHHALNGAVSAWVLNGRTVVESRFLTPSRVNSGWQLAEAK